MASGVHALVVGAPVDAGIYLRDRLAELERRWSRFLPESDISRLNAAPGRPVSVSPETMVLIMAMKQARRATGRRYDPTQLAALLAAGYTHSVDGSGRTSAMASGEAVVASLDDVLVDPGASTACLPAGIGLDPGGIAKGLAADLLVGELLAGGSRGALVSIGGDLAAGGEPPADGWQVAVEDPLAPPCELTTLVLDGGGVATSSTRSRTWLRDGRRYHHVFDPISRAPSLTDLATVTVIAPTGWEAEAHATGALLCGSQGALGYLGQRRLSGLAVTAGGELLATPDLTLALSAGRSPS